MLHKFLSHNLFKEVHHWPLFAFPVVNFKETNVKKNYVTKVPCPGLEPGGGEAIVTSNVFNDWATLRSTLVRSKLIAPFRKRQKPSLLLVAF